MKTIKNLMNSAMAYAMESPYKKRISRNYRISRWPKKKFWMEGAVFVKPKALSVLYLKPRKPNAGNWRYYGHKKRLSSIISTLFDKRHVYIKPKRKIVYNQNLHKLNKIKKILKKSNKALLPEYDWFSTVKPRSRRNIKYIIRHTRDINGVFAGFRNKKKRKPLFIRKMRDFFTMKRRWVTRKKFNYFLIYNMGLLREINVFYGKPLYQACRRVKKKKHFRIRNIASVVLTRKRLAYAKVSVVHKKYYNRLLTILIKKTNKLRILLNYNFFKHSEKKKLRLKKKIIFEYCFLKKLLNLYYKILKRGKKAIYSYGIQTLRFFFDNIKKKIYNWQKIKFYNFAYSFSLDEPNQNTYEFIMILYKNFKINLKLKNYCLFFFIISNLVQKKKNILNSYGGLTKQKLIAMSFQQRRRILGWFYPVLTRKYNYRKKYFLISLKNNEVRKKARFLKKKKRIRRLVKIAVERIKLLKNTPEILFENKEKHYVKEKFGEILKKKKLIKIKKLIKKKNRITELQAFIKTLFI